MTILLRDFIQHTHIDNALVRAVIRQLGECWVDVQDTLQSIAHHGVDGGFGGFIYYTETCAFYRRNRQTINNLLSQMADDLGEPLLDMVQHFNCLGDSYTLEEIALTLFGTPRQQHDHVANALAWFAAEEVARSFSDYAYDVERSA